MSAPDVVERARAWIADDPDPVTRGELQRLLGDTSDAGRAELAARFDGTLTFGTAGLRGELGAGPRRMNRVVVARAAVGLARYLREVATDPSVVVGYDARHMSERFALDTAELMTAAGVRVLLLPQPLPTPVLAFAIRHLGASAGVMVTASHNPPRDNGYKVYLGDGVQIVPPADADIADRIAAVGTVAGLDRSDDYTVLGSEVEDAYVDAVGALPGDGPRDLVVAYTPLHGVGGRVAERIVARAGFAPLHVVAEQRDPDPEFPTVSFPNPEEPGATDLLLALAEEAGADLVVANDPDADRCAIGAATDGAWRMLSGDETGVLLADHLLRRGVRGTFATTIVSSTMLRALAADHGQPYAETLTGFKWIGRVDGLAFGYEEALGYAAAPHVTPDKDGLSAMVLALELAAGLKGDGLTLGDRLDELARRHGVHANGQLSVRVDDVALIAAAMERLRREPPARLGGLDVLGVDDLAGGEDGRPPTDGLRLRLDAGARVVVRPSGTEPKLKCYLEVVATVTDDDPGAVAAERIAAATRLDAIRGDLALLVG